MPEISMSVLDIAENSTRARASLVQISITIDTAEDLAKVNEIYRNMN